MQQAGDSRFRQKQINRICTFKGDDAQRVWNSWQTVKVKKQKIQQKQVTQQVRVISNTHNSKEQVKPPRVKQTITKEKTCQRRIKTVINKIKQEVTNSETQTARIGT